MKTKNWFKRFAALAVAVLTMAGCRNDVPEAPVGIPDWNNVKFDVAVTVATPGKGGETRAAKTGWTTGDGIVAFFDGDKDNYVMLRYDGTKWNRTAIEIGGSLAAKGSLLAMHAGNGTEFDFAGGDITGIAGEALCTFFDSDGSYTYDAESSTVSIALTLKRATNIVRVAGGDSKDENMEWRLVGSGIEVMTGSRIGAANFIEDPVIAIANLFEAQDIGEGIVAVPDAKFTDDTEAVFHVWYGGSGSDPVELKMYKTSDPGTVYTRTYPAETFTFGVTATLQGPAGSSESDQWTVNIPPTLTEVVVFAVAGTQYGDPGKLIAMTPDGLVKKVISDGAVAGHDFRRIALHPDGKTAVVQDGSYNMYVYDLKTGQSVELTEAAGGDEAVWHPSGETILFTGHDGTDYRAMSIKPDGTGKTILTPDWALYRANYTPDGTRIVAREDVDSGYIATFDADGSNGTKICNEAGIQYDCPWPVSNERIFYLSIDDEWIYSLCTAEIDGSNPQTLETFDSDFFWIDYLCTNADGTLISYKLNDLFVVRKLNGTTPGDEVLSFDATGFVRFKFGFIDSEIFDSLPPLTD